MITPEYIAASSVEFRQILQLSCLQLAATDQQFTALEQQWVDAYFGPGAGDSFIQQFAAIDWDQIYGQIQTLYGNLSVAEKEALQTNGREWFTELLSVDGLENEELACLESLMALFAETNAEPTLYPAQELPAPPPVQEESESTENNNETGKPINLWEFLLYHRKRILWALLIITVTGIYFYDHLTAKTAEEIRVDIIGVWNPDLKNPVGGTFLFYEGGKAEWRVDGEVDNYRWTVESGRDGRIHIVSGKVNLFFRLRDSKLLELIEMQKDIQLGNPAFGGGGTTISGQRLESKGRYFYRKK